MKRTLLMAVLVLSGTVMAAAQSASPAPQAATQTAAGTHTWTMEQIVTSSVREAWALGGKTEDGFFQIVQALTELSAQKRGVTLPDTQEAGTKAGNWIKKEAKRDPDQLLYVVVDRAVQYTGTHPSASTPATK